MKSISHPVSRIFNVFEPVFSFSLLRRGVLLIASVALTAQGAFGQSANLEQGRNGPKENPVSPVEWANGNLNEQQSHYVEGYSIPYRLVMTDLPTGEVITLTLGYDITHNYKHALDYLTHFQRMDDPAHGAPYFPHEGDEEVKPVIGTALGDGNGDVLGSVTVTTYFIPEPPGTGTVTYAPDQPGASWLNNQSEAYMTLYGGVIQDISYPSDADLNLKDATQEIQIQFIADSSTAVLAWGGHIASRYEWGVDPDTMEPYSAGAINGSPYHMRKVDWNIGNLGNTDRSLSASAVVTLEPCDIIGATEICFNGPFSFELQDTADSYSWTIVAAPDDPYPTDQIVFVGGIDDTQMIWLQPLVAPTPTTNKFILQATVNGGSGTANTCEFMVTIIIPPDCTIIEPQEVVIASSTYTYEAPAGLDYYEWSITGDAVINGDTDQQSVSITTGDIAGGQFTLSVTTGILNGEDICYNDCSISVPRFEDATVPDIECPPDVTIECDESISPDNTGYATATDGVDGQLTPTHEDDDSGLDSCGNGIIIRTWTATDSSGNSVSCDQIITIEDTTAPVLSIPADTSFSCQLGAAGTATATDNCDNDPTVSSSDNLSGLNTCGLGIILRTWKAVDCTGNESTGVQTILIFDNEAPVIAPAPQDVTVECIGDVPSASDLPASDNCDTSITQATASDGDPVGDACSPEGQTIIRTWSVTDCAGNTSSVSQTITVVDTTAPVLSIPDDTSFDCQIGDAGTATATDNCDINPTVSSSDDLSGLNTCGLGIILRTWKAVDCTGNESTGVQTITIVDNDAPVINPAPNDITVECLGDVPSASDLPASDNCDTSVTLATASDGDPVGDACSPEGQTITRTWSVTDCAGNTSSVSQIITVIDTTAPVAPLAPADTTVECEGDVPAKSSLTALDSCGGSITVNPVDSPAELDDCGNQIITRTWVFSDCTGNTSSVSQTITVVDTTAPVLSIPDDASFECSMGDSGTATATDNCDPSPEVTYSDDETGLDSCGYGTIVRTWKAVDCSGNEVEETQNITVEDTTPPTITAPRGEIRACGDCWTIDQIPPADPSLVTAFDNCDGELVAEAMPLRPIGLRDCETGEILEGECPGGWERVWYAEDCAGNRAEAVEQYLCLSSNEITDSSLCMFDRTCEEPDQQFRVIYTPDTKNDPYHMISSTNPGQFFYNIFYVGTPGEVVDVEVCLPFPFITKGANPIHIYDWVTIEECGIFGVRFIPGDEFYVDSQQITLENHIPPTGPDDTLEGYCFDELISFTVPDTGVAYVNIHLQYGVVRMGDFDQDVKQNAVDPRTKNIYLKNRAAHFFSFGLWNNSPIDSDPDMTGESVAYNLNDFQKTAGVTGTVIDGDGNGVAGATITMTAGNRRRADITFNVTTDADGEYFIPYVHQGTPKVFQVTLSSPGPVQPTQVFLKNKGLATQDFIVP